jgi:hypothetical protein
MLLPYPETIQNACISPLFRFLHVAAVTLYSTAESVAVLQAQDTGKRIPPTMTAAYHWGSDADPLTKSPRAGMSADFTDSSHIGD